ncbi:HAD-IIB family hydrolase [Candidatus Woesearchaeota archaeon]|nr:HAD-IIB family hydrolase [Candidatus Woesearchaeota archaeon]
MKFLVFDVDGTIVESTQELGEEFQKIFLTLNNKFSLVFISGTNKTELNRMVSSKLGSIDHFIISNSGSICDKIESKKTFNLWKDSLEEKDKEKIKNSLNLLSKEYNLIPITSKEDQILDRGSQITFSILGRNAPLEKKKNYDPDTSKRKSFIQFLNNNGLNEEYDLKIGGTTSIDITLKGINKEYGLKKFMEINKLLKDQIIFFGDQLEEGGNDFPVKKLGIRTIKVKNPKDCLEKLNPFLL